MGHYRLSPAFLALSAWGFSAVVSAQVPEGYERPVPIGSPEVRYPTDAQGQRVEIDMVLTLDATGHVTFVEVRHRAPVDAPESFVTAAIEAARAMVFQPARSHGAPMAIRVPYRMVIAPPEAAPADPGPRTDVTARTGVEAPPVRVEAPPVRVESPPVQPTTVVASPAEDPVGEGLVRARGVAPPRGAGDVTIPIGQLGNVPNNNATELLRLAPGIFLLNGLGEGHAEQVFLRGFDARLGQDLEFTVNGVPVNEPANAHGHGLADTHFIIPELVDSLRVLEGPFDPHQGDFAVAGSAAYTLRVPVRGALARYRLGSFGSHRAVGLWAPESEREGTFAAVELATGDGYGQNRAFDRASVNVQYESRTANGTIWRVLAMSYATRYRSAGVVRQDDYDNNRIGFYGTYDPTQGGDVMRHTVAAEVERTTDNHTLKAQVGFGLRDFHLRENFTGFLLDTQRAGQSPHEQRGDAIEQTSSATDVFARASSRFRGTFREIPQAVELGLYARYVSTGSLQQRLRSSTIVPYSTDFDLQTSVADIGLFVDSELRPTRWITLRGGLRADLFQYGVLDRCAVRGTYVRGAPLDAECLSADRSGYRNPAERRTSGGIYLQPRGVLQLGPWRNTVLSAGLGLGARSTDPVYLGDGQLAPFSPVLAFEAGVVYDKRFTSSSLMARALYFRTHVGQDLIFSEAEGRNTLASGTTRQGALVAARFTSRWLDAAAHVTYSNATFDDTGMLVPYVPDLVSRLDASAHFPLPIRLRDRALSMTASLGVTYVGPRALPLSQRGDALFTTDVSTSVRWTYLELGVSWQNLLDSRYQQGQYNFVSDFRSQPFPTLVATRSFTAGAPRTFFVTLSLYLGSAAARHGSTQGAS